MRDSSLALPEHSLTGLKLSFGLRIPIRVLPEGVCCPRIASVTRVVNSVKKLFTLQFQFSRGLLALLLQRARGKVCETKFLLQRNVAKPRISPDVRNARCASAATSNSAFAGENGQKLFIRHRAKALPLHCIRVAITRIAEYAFDLENLLRVTGSQHSTKRQPFPVKFVEAFFRPKQSNAILPFRGKVWNLYPVSSFVGFASSTPSSQNKLVAARCRAFTWSTSKCSGVIGIAFKASPTVPYVIPRRLFSCDTVQHTTLLRQ